MTDSQAEEEEGHTWIWLAAVGGAALAAVGIVYALRVRDPGYRMDRLLRRCEARIDGVEVSLAQLEQSLADSPS
ncbi:MAG: hypothetical protein MUQ26_08180 [Armatimonadetes bacterium]|nr:hypothetical protein [Armatimonadota bacterium]